jgi:peroxiredoxin|tara:strand:- start:177 stop:794 length:618 start_codon:yes stop_codon:yes gene_type:complete
MSVKIRRLSIIVMLTALFSTVACSSTPATTPTAATSSTPTVATTTAHTDSDLLPIAPVFSVSTIDGENIRLEDLLGVTPVYLLFVPTTTDDLDISQLRLIQSQISEFDELGAKVVVVVSDQPTRVIEMRDDLVLDFPLIADPLNVIASDWQVFDLNDDGRASPASFVFDAHGSLIARLIANEPGNRPTVSEVVSVLEESLKVDTA